MNRIALAGIALLAFGVVMAGDGDTPPADEPEWDGILPSLHNLLFVSDSLKLRYPEKAVPPDERIVYNRRLPFMAQKAVDRGYALPRPFGISLLGVQNVQDQVITEPNVALGKGEPPPPGTELRPLPPVELQNTVSDTDSVQLKGDVWLLPFLNVFATIGRVRGDVNLDVVVDLDTAFPPPVCTPIDPCGTVSANFDAGVDTYTTTLGSTGVYAWSNWFLGVTASGTASFGENTDTTIRSWTGSARVGRRWMFAKANILAPYIGVSYFNLDQIVEGTTRLPDAFPDGDSLDVRYRIRTENLDKWTGVVGLNIGLVNALSLGGEFAYSENSQRITLVVNYRL